MDSNDRERIDGDNGARDELHRMVSLQKSGINKVLEIYCNLVENRIFLKLHQNLCK